MTSERLFKHIQTLKPYEASFRCGCCNMFEWDIYSERNFESRKKEYKILKEYLQSVWDIINSRGDFKEVKNKNRLKHEMKKIKGEDGGHQKKSRSKRRLERRKKGYNAKKLRKNKW